MAVAPPSKRSGLDPPCSGRPAHGAADGALLQPLQPAALVHLGKHEALELDGDPVDADGPRHARRQLVAVAEELVTVGLSEMVCCSPPANFYAAGEVDLSVQGGSCILYPDATLWGGR